MSVLPSSPLHSPLHPDSSMEREDASWRTGGRDEAVASFRVDALSAAGAEGCDGGGSPLYRRLQRVDRANGPWRTKLGCSGIGTGGGEDQAGGGEDRAGGGEV